MLKGIDPLIVPDLLQALAQMGHGDELAVVDRNYPAHRHGGSVVELPGADVTAVLEAVLRLLPVDAHQDPAAWHMLTDEGDHGPAVVPVAAALDAAEGRSVPFAGISRQRFYERAAQAFCTIRTSDARPYACFLVAKGVV